MNTRSRHRSNLFGTSLLAALVISVASVGATTACHAGPYVVAKAGSSKWEDFSGDDADTYGSVGVGFNAGKYLSFELSYNDLGEVTGDEAGDVRAKAFSTSVAGYLNWPISTVFGAFLKLGLESWKADLDVDGDSDRINGTGSFAGVGVKAGFGPIDFSVFYELHKFDEQGKRSDAAQPYDDFDIDIVGAGLAYRF